MVAYRIQFSPQVEDNLRWLRPRDRAIVLDSIQQQLTHQPTVETRNRKPMRPNPLASWELRVGDLRVYYCVEFEPESIVEVLSVGIKKREQIWIGNQRIEL